MAMLRQELRKEGGDRSTKALTTPLLLIENLDREIYKSVESFFENLAPDEHNDADSEEAKRKGEFSRLRGYRKLIIDGDDVTFAPYESFSQTGDVNQLNGEKDRPFESLSPALLLDDGFKQLVRYFKRKFTDSERAKLGCHQMRVRSVNWRDGLPSPEGIHCDGMDQIGMFVVKRHNIIGSHTQLYHQPCDPQPFLSITQEEYSALLVDDRQMYHYVTPFKPKNRGMEAAFRDVFVFTFKHSEQKDV